MLGNGNTSIHKAAAIAAFVAVSTAPFHSAQATNGMNMYGFGPTAKGMAGIGAAYSNDALAMATNPAGMAWVGRRGDMDVTLFSPDRELNVGAAGSITDNTSDNRLFLMPNIGANYPINDNHSIGIGLTSAGGMNTEWPTAVYAAFGAGSVPTGVDMAHAFLGVNYAAKFDALDAKHSVGVMPYGAFDRFKAYGLEAFQGISQDGRHVTGNGYDHSYGYGVRFGYQGRFANEDLMIGASYQTRTYMTEFTKYKGLFAEEGDFDLAPVINAGIAYRISPKFLVSFDYSYILYNDVASISNHGPRTPLASLPAENQLGKDQGLGFGWEDMGILKIGAEWRYNDRLTARFGISHATQTYDGQEIMFNFLAPGVVRTHVTVGATYDMTDKLAINLAYSRGLSNDISGTDPNLAGQVVATEMNQHEGTVGLSYRW